MNCVAKQVMEKCYPAQNWTATTSHQSKKKSTERVLIETSSETVNTPVKERVWKGVTSLWFRTKQYFPQTIKGSVINQGKLFKDNKETTQKYRGYILIIPENITLQNKELTNKEEKCDTLSGLQYMLLVSAGKLADADYHTILMPSSSSIYVLDTNKTQKPLSDKAVL